MSDAPASTANEAPLSLKRLTNAFAAMLGRKSTPNADESGSGIREVTVDTPTITEALLFVGRPDNKPLSADDMAATMRDISADEVHQAVEQLNAQYEADAAAMTIAKSAAGYRMVLRDDLTRVRDKFYGKVQQATLTPTAMEVLSVIAYRQPVTLKKIDELRGQKSQALASSLVRRGLVRIERTSENPKQPEYFVTDRFLKLFGISSIDQLPQAVEFDAA